MSAREWFFEEKKKQFTYPGRPRLRRLREAAALTGHRTGGVNRARKPCPGVTAGGGWPGGTRGGGQESAGYNGNLAAVHKWKKNREIQINP